MIAIINGPNLNCLGLRQPEIYGTESFESYYSSLCFEFSDMDLSYFQTNSEGEIIDIIQKLGFHSLDCRGIVINPGAYSHYSYAIADAISSIKLPVVEVHISNIASREEFRNKSVTGARCKGIISGLGLKGYDLAISYLRSFDDARS